MNEYHYVITVTRPRRSQHVHSFTTSFFKSIEYWAADWDRRKHFSTHWARSASKYDKTPKVTGTSTRVICIHQSREKQLVLLPIEGQLKKKGSSNISSTGLLNSTVDPFRQEKSLVRLKCSYSFPKTFKWSREYRETLTKHFRKTVVINIGLPIGLIDKVQAFAVIMDLFILSKWVKFTNVVEKMKSIFSKICDIFC